MATAASISAAFIRGAPPGELAEVVNDIRTLTDDADAAALRPALRQHSEEQLVVVKLPGSTQHTLISAYNRVPDDDDRYFDPRSQTSFHVDHVTATASQPQPYVPASASASALTDALNAALGRHFAEHYPPSSGGTSSGFLVTADPTAPGTVAILLSTTKASPGNFLSARWRSSFAYAPASRTLRGTIAINVHYYEDGNVALTTTKRIADTEVGPAAGGAGEAEAVVARIAALEKQHQEHVNRTFVAMNEQGFKALRRQLPVTRQKVEWEKIRGYNLSDTLKGAAHQTPT